MRIFLSYILKIYKPKFKNAVIISVNNKYSERIVNDKAKNHMDIPKSQRKFRNFGVKNFKN